MAGQIDSLESLLKGIYGNDTAGMNSFLEQNNISLDDYNLTPSSDGSWMDTLGGFDGIKGVLGLGQLGLGIMGYLDNKKTAEKQRQLLGQQIDTNKFLLTQAKDRQGDISSQFGNSGVASGGLAASAATTPTTRKVL